MFLEKMCVDLSSLNVCENLGVFSIKDYLAQFLPS